MRLSLKIKKLYNAHPDLILFRVVKIVVAIGVGAIGTPTKNLR